MQIRCIEEKCCPALSVLFRASTSFRCSVGLWSFWLFSSGWSTASLLWLWRSVFFRFDGFILILMFITILFDWLFLSRAFLCGFWWSSRFLRRTCRTSSSAFWTVGFGSISIFSLWLRRSSTSFFGRACSLKSKKSWIIIGNFNIPEMPSHFQRRHSTILGCWRLGFVRSQWFRQRQTWFDQWLEGLKLKKYIQQT